MSRKEDHYLSWVKLLTGLYILTILEQGAAHGHKIACEIQRRTEGEMSPNPNALYPLLRIIEERGYIVGQWENPTTRGKRIYSITTEGIQYLPVLRAKFQQRLEETERRLAIYRRDLLQ